MSSNKDELQEPKIGDLYIWQRDSGKNPCIVRVYGNKLTSKFGDESWECVRPDGGLVRAFLKLRPDKWTRITKKIERVSELEEGQFYRIIGGSLLCYCSSAPHFRFNRIVKSSVSNNLLVYGEFGITKEEVCWASSAYFEGYLEGPIANPTLVQEETSKEVTKEVPIKPVADSRVCKLGCNPANPCLVKGCLAVKHIVDERTISIDQMILDSIINKKELVDAYEPPVSGRGGGFVSIWRVR